MSKNALIRHLVLEGKTETETWLQLAIKFKIAEGRSNKQRAKAANDIWRNYKKGTPSSLNIPLKYCSSNHKEEGMYLILGCVHAPFVNKSLWISILRLIQDQKDNISGLILNGDFLDLNTLSFHDKGRIPPIEGMSLGWEYLESKKYLNSILDELPQDVYKGFIWGNHEHRYKRYIGTLEGSKHKGALKDPTTALQLQHHGFEVFENWKSDFIQLGNLKIFHGESVNEHVAYKELQLEKQSVLFAHTHRIQSHIEKNYIAHSIGTIADINSPVFSYANKTMRLKWRNGFAIGTLMNNHTSVEQVVWNEDHFIFGGRKYTP